MEGHTNKHMRTTVQTPQATTFWELPTTTSPSAANCCTPWRNLVKRGPKQRPPAFCEMSISAVIRITSFVLGGDLSDCFRWFRNATFWLPERLASNWETAWANRISGFRGPAVDRTRDIAETVYFRKVGASSRQRRLRGRVWPSSWEPSRLMIVS